MLIGSAYSLLYGSALRCRGEGGEIAFPPSSRAINRNGIFICRPAGYVFICGRSHSNVNRNSGEGYFLRQRRTVGAWTHHLDIETPLLGYWAAAVHGEVTITLTLIAELTVINFTQGLQRF